MLNKAFGGLSGKKGPGGARRFFSLPPRRARPPKGGLLLVYTVDFYVRRNVLHY